jgi:estrogen-related receptor beta like 1
MSNSEEEEKQASNEEKQEKFIGSAYVLMEDIVEKLKLLNYEDVFPPISRSFFINQNKNNPGEQFRTLVDYMSWILQDLLKVPGYEPPDQYADPNTTASFLVTELKGVGIVIDSPAKLRLGYGDSVCYALDQLLDAAIQKLGIKFKQASFPQNMIFKEDDEIYEEDVEEQEEEAEESEEEEEMYMEVPDSARKENSQLIARKQFIESDVNAQEWKLELEQVAPQLILRLNADHKDWRTHVESMKEQEKIIKELLPETVEKLERVAEEIKKLTERISKREKMLSNDASISSMLQSYKNNQEELEQITSKYKEHEESISVLSNELSTISTELEEVKNEVESLRNKMGDTTPLNQIKEALQQLKIEIRNMDMRTGVLTDSLLQARIKSTRAQSATTQKHIKRAQSAGIIPEQFGFDPFAINNETSLLMDEYS